MPKPAHAHPEALLFLQPCSHYVENGTQLIDMAQYGLPGVFISALAAGDLAGDTHLLEAKKITTVISFDPGDEPTYLNQDGVRLVNYDVTGTCLLAFC